MILEPINMNKPEYRNNSLQPIWKRRLLVENEWFDIILHVNLYEDMIFVEEYKTILEICHDNEEKIKYRCLNYNDGL